MTDEENSQIDAPDHTLVSGAINQHTPSYWRLALPALGVRYGATFFQDLTNHTHAQGSKAAKYFDSAAGLWMLAVTSFFAKRTWSDLQRLFAETIAYEFDKKPGEIVVQDIMRSQNKAVVMARKNFFKYNGVRALVNGSFFASWLPWSPSKNWKKFSETSAINLGMGANSAYLVSEVLGRGRTFFEQVQSFADSKLNQANALGDDVRPIDLIHLFERNAIDNDPQHAFRGQVDSAIWKDSQIIFARMADLMNSTYQHKHNGESANFTLPKFLYLVGNNLIRPDKVEQSLAYVEVANRYGMEALKKVVREVETGTALVNALQSYPLTLPETAPAREEAPAQAPHAEKIPVPPVAYTDKTAKSPDKGISQQF